MLTKKEKTVQIEDGKKLLKDNQTMIFLDLTGVDAETTKQLRRLVRAEGGAMKVLKKRLLRVAMKEAGFDFDPEQFTSQLATIFAPKDISEIAGSVYTFLKKNHTKKDAKPILGGYDILAKNFLDAAMVNQIGQLPSRDVLLGQVVGTLAGPIRAFLYVLSEKAKMVDVPRQSEATAGAN